MCTARSGKYTDVPRSYASAIERAALLHVVRDVGDVHAEPVVAVRQPLDRDRVVEVARVLAVDRHGRDVPEVGAAADVARPTPTPPRRTASATASRTVRVRDAVLADDDLGVDAGRVDVAEHVGDAAERRRASRSASASARRSPCRRATRRLPGRAGRRCPSARAGRTARRSPCRCRRGRSGRRATRCVRSRMRMMRPSTRPPSLTRSMRATTRSPCIASFRCGPEM